jgi:predicted dithiol-disulfide oxidoreductase (DUF899 family)
MVGRWPGESPAYAKIRDELQEAELALRDQRERVAALRRNLPLDQLIDDEVFEEIREGARVPVRLSELFDDPSKPLVLMHFMFGKALEQPCPMCTGWADGYDGVVPHLRRRVSFAVLAAGDAAVLEAWGRERGWRNLRLVSAATSELKRRLGFETEDGSQLPGVSVFAKQRGRLVHFYSQCAFLGAGQFRGMDLLSPIWHYLDLTPEGRGDFMPQRRYDDTLG